MDNFSGHELAVQLVGGLQGLSNIRIAWLPPNTTSVWQPIDQGIIASFKLQYRRQWVTFMLREYEAGKNPQRTMNLLKAIQQTRVVQEQSVTTDYIKKCWQKSTIIQKPVVEEPTTEDDEAAERTELQEQITQLPIKDALSLNEFLNPSNETILDKDDDIFVSVLDYYSIDTVGEELESSDEEVEEVDTAKALRCIKTVKLWKLQKGNNQDLQALDRIGREIRQYKSSTAKQTTIHRFLSINRCHGLNAMSQSINGLYSKEVLLKKKQDPYIKERKYKYRVSFCTGYYMTRGSCTYT